MSESEAKKYNPEEVRNLDARKKEAADIAARQKELGYDKKTPEGKLKLSQEWIKKAGLSPKMIKEICAELEIPDLNDPKLVEQAVKSWQEKNGMSGKNADGIMGWATLEKLDTVITDKHNTMNDDGLDSRLVNAGEEETNEAEKAEAEKTFKNDMNQMAAELKDGNGIEDERLPKGVGVDQDKQVLVKTDDKTQFWDTNKDGGSWNSRTDELKNEENIAGIKDVLGKLDTFEEGQEYVKTLGTSTAYSEKDMSDFNAILKGKGWEMRMDDQGEFQEYALVDLKAEKEEIRLAEMKKTDPLIALEEDFGSYTADTTGSVNHKLSNVFLSQIDRGLDWWENTAENAALKKTFLDASIQAKEFVKKNPDLGDITLSEYTELRKNPDAFLLGERANDRFFGEKRARLVSKASRNGAEYGKTEGLWTKKEGEKISVATGDKFISFEEYATKNLNKATPEPVQVPGSENLFYTVEYSGGKKQIVIGTKGEDGSIKSDKARYYVNGEWRDSNVG